MAADNIWLAAASSSLAVAVLTQAFTIGREKLAHRADQRFSALHVALALESYGGECAHVLGENRRMLHCSPPRAKSRTGAPKPA